MSQAKLQRLAHIFLFAMAVSCVHVYRASVALDKNDQAARLSSPAGLTHSVTTTATAVQQQQQQQRRRVVSAPWKRHESVQVAAAVDDASAATTTVQSDAVAAAAAVQSGAATTPVQHRERLEAVAAKAAGAAKAAELAAAAQQQQPRQQQPPQPQQQSAASIEVGETIFVEKPAAPKPAAPAVKKQQPVMNNNNNKAQNLDQPHPVTNIKVTNKAAVQRQCDCTNPQCQTCHRGLLQVHKMGVTLMNTVMWKYFRGKKIAEIVQHDTLGAKFHDFRMLPVQPSKDYRHVVVTRDFDAALLTGYLYHRDHLECELDWFGKPGFNGWLLNNSQEDWEARIVNATANTAHYLSWPPGRGRDLCTYLSDESERDGLLVYMTWAKNIYLDPLLQFVRNRKKLEQKNGAKKTLFMCYDAFLTNYTQSVQQIGQWFVPGSTPINVTPNDGSTDRDKRDELQAHATNKDPVVRTRLRNLVRELDATVFGRAIAAGNAVLNCQARDTATTATTATTTTI